MAHFCEIARAASLPSLTKSHMCHVALNCIREPWAHYLVHHLDSKTKLASTLHSILLLMSCISAHSQLLCTYYNKCSHMLSIVDTWGCMQYFFKSCFAIRTTSFCSVSLTRMHWHLVPQQKKQSYTKAAMHWYTTSNRQGNIFPYEGFCQIAQWWLVYSHRWCIYIPPLSTKHFSLKKVLC
jgi:hypothetical protein